MDGISDEVRPKGHTAEDSSHSWEHVKAPVRGTIKVKDT